MYNKHKTITNGKFISMSEMCEVTASYACLLEREIFLGSLKYAKVNILGLGFMHRRASIHRVEKCDVTNMKNVIVTLR